MSTSQPRIRLGVSACLLGERVRYDASHKRDDFVADVLSRYFELVPLCPEVAIGLGIPRPPIRLSGDPESPRAVGVKDPGLDVTERLTDQARSVCRQYPDLSGYVLKARSPSCGMERVRIYHANGMPLASGPGVYARTLMSERPLLPLEEEGRLNDAGLRDSFLDRVYLFHQWQSMLRDGLSAAALVRLHTEHKFLLMAYDQSTCRALGRLVASCGTQDVHALGERYIRLALDCMRTPARPGNHVNVLQHMAGFLSKRISAEDRAELSQAIDAYRLGEAPIVVALTLLRHHLRKQQESYLHGQRYLQPRPHALNRTR